MRMLSLAALSTALLSGCVTGNSILNATGIWPANQSTTHAIPQERGSIKNSEFSSLLRVYELRQPEDSAYISERAMKDVAGMVTCPPIDSVSGLRKYSAKPILHTASMSIRVEVNRPNCSVDIEAVRAHIDLSISEARSARLEISRREREAREADPRGPYFMGCTDYQRFVRGETTINQPNPREAIKRYSKVNPAYASRLYVTGWEDARAYGVRSVNCGYLTNLNIGP